MHRVVVIDALGTPEEVFRELRGVLEERIEVLMPTRQVALWETPNVETLL